MATEVRRLTCWFRLGGCLLALLTGPLLHAAQELPSSEHQIKAAYLVNFAKFITWPVTAFRDANEPILIGVLGVDPFPADLSRAVENQRAQNRTLGIVRGTTVSMVAHCHIVFFGNSEAARFKTQLAELAATGRPVVTVGEHPEFIRAGGMIRFVVDDKRVHFEIKPEAAAGAGVIVSSKLLNLALKPGESRKRN